MLRRVAVLAATLVVGASLTIGGAPAQAGVDPALVGAPEVGACYDLTLKQAYEYATPELPVECSADHTAVVTGLGRLPDGAAWSDKDAVQRAIAKQCPSTWWGAIGGRDPLRVYRSQYSFWVFAPTTADREVGARWFSCLVSIQDDRGLVDLPNRLPQLTQQLPNSVARCVTSKYDFTTCADTHAWRSSYAFYARGKMTNRAIDAAANRVCPRHVTSRSWLRSASDVQGKRFMVACYSKTRR